MTLIDQQDRKFITILFNRGPSYQGKKAFIGLGDLYTPKPLPAQGAYEKGVLEFKKRILGESQRVTLTREQLLEEIVGSRLTDTKDQAERLIPHLVDSGFGYKVAGQVNLLMFKELGKKDYSVEAYEGMAAQPFS